MNFPTQSPFANKKKYFKGNTLADLIFIVLLLIAAIILSSHRNRITPAHSSDSATNFNIANGIPGDDIIRTWKEQATLVIVGRMITCRRMAKQDFYNYIVDGYYDITVEKVERGYYPYNNISFCIGWYSSSSWGTYPPFMKKQYKTGERMRVFLKYDPNRMVYYPEGALYSIEPLP
jgi:hypothetical protein